MALTGFWGLELSKKTKLVLTNEDLDFFEQQGFIDATIKAMILKQARHKWMKPYDRFWNMPEESRAILFSPGANAKRIAARRALLDKDPFDLSTYAPKPAPVRIDINISSEGPAAPDDNDDSYKLPAAFRSYRVTPRMAPLLRQALPELESYLQALTAHWKELLEVLEAGGDVQLWVGKSEEILRQHPWAAFEQAHPELTAQPEFRLLWEPVIATHFLNLLHRPLSENTYYLSKPSCGFSERRPPDSPSQVQNQACGAMYPGLGI
jgi:hypothetical protein